MPENPASTAGQPPVPMRMLHIITSLDLKGGGPPQAVRNLIKNRPAGFTNDVLTLDPPSAPFLEGLPFAVHAVGTDPWRWYSPHLIPWLRAHRNDYDGIILHGLWGSTSIGVLRAVARHVPYGVFPHGMLDPYFKASRLKHLKKWPFWLAVQYWILRLADRVFFTTTAEAELAPQSFWLSRWTPAVINYGTDMPIVDEPAAHAAFQALCPEVTNKRFLLYLSRIHPKKGIDLLLQAATDLADHLEREDIHLVIAGPDHDNLREQLTQQPGYDHIANRVHWPGMLSGDAKWGAFLGSEVFILPSHQENFGIANAEALALGKPVLITDKVNIAPDILADNSGYVEPDTLPGIRALLTRWLATPPTERATMSTRARHTFTNRYDMKKNTALIFSNFKPRPRPTRTEPLQ
jgi:glycosyltransferase involved in cell wall biosynthesis